MLEEKWICSPLSFLLPVPFFLLAIFCIGLNPLLCGIAILLLVSSYLWDFKGLAFSFFASLFVLLYVQPHLFIELKSSVFFLIAINTGILASLVKKSFVSALKESQEEIASLKEWEVKYQNLYDLLQKTEEKLFFIDLQCQTLEKERLTESLDEDLHSTALVKLILGSQQKCLELEEEIKVLEEVALKASKGKVTPAKVVRKRKPKEEKGQGLLQLMLD